MATLSELSTELLARYKSGAGKQASAADKAAIEAKTRAERQKKTALANKRFKGIMKATTKQFANDAKKHQGVQEEVEQIDELSKATVKSYADKRSAQVFDAPPYPFKKKPMSARVAKNTGDGMMRALKRMKKTNEEVELEEEVKTTHADPLVTVHKGNSLHTHANLSVANSIHGTKVSAADVHKGPVKADGFTFAVSKHHESEMKKDAMKEEVEQIDELKKTTLASYTSKVVDPVYGMPRTTNKLKQRLAGLSRAHQRAIGKKPTSESVSSDDEAQVNEASSTPGKVWRGEARQAIAKKIPYSPLGLRNYTAAKKAVKEQVELEEADKKVHPDALHVSHVGGGKYKVHAVGSNFSHGIKVGEHLSDSELDDFSEMGGKIKHMKKTSEEFFSELHSGEVVFEDGTALVVDQETAAKILSTMESINYVAREQLAETCMRSPVHLLATAALIR